MKDLTCRDWLCFAGLIGLMTIVYYGLNALTRIF